MVSKLPEKFQPFKLDAEKLLAEDRVATMEFSGGTYQVQVNPSDSDESVWSFLQFDEKNRIKDCFCSCVIQKSLPMLH